MRRPRSGAAQDGRVQRLSVGSSVLRLPGAVIALARDWLTRFINVQGFDRAMSISAYAYSALFPLLIVYASLLPRADNADFADVLIKEFRLSGSTAASVKIAFSPAGEVQSSVTFLGVFL